MKNKTKLITIDYDEYERMLRTHKQVNDDVLTQLNKVLIQYQLDFPNREIDILINNLLSYIKSRMYDNGGKNNE